MAQSSDTNKAKSKALSKSKGKDEEKKKKIDPGSGKEQKVIGQIDGKDVLQYMGNDTYAIGEIFLIRGFLEKADEANQKLSEDFGKLEVDKQKIEGKHKEATNLISALKQELKEMAAALDKAKQGYSQPSQVLPDHENEDPPEAPLNVSNPDALCLVCKTYFSSLKSLIKDPKSPHFKSLKCPGCGKVQNAEGGHERFRLTPKR